MMGLRFCVDTLCQANVVMEVFLFFCFFCKRSSGIHSLGTRGDVRACMLT